MKPHTQIPAPKSKDILQNIILGNQGSLRWLVQLQQQLGDVIHVQIASKHIYFLFHPDDAQRVLQMNNRNYLKGALFDNLRKVGGNGLFTSEGDFWRRQRRMMQPFFHRRMIDQFGQIMVSETTNMLTQWQQRTQPFPLNEAMMYLTLSVVAKALFTTALSATQLQTVHDTLSPLLMEVSKRTRRPFTFTQKLPLPANRAFTQNLATLNTLIYEIINQRRQDNGRYNDLLQMLIEAEDEETGEQMSDEQLRDEVITLFVAGHETTAAALTWAFTLLSQNPTVRHTLQKEVDDVLGGREPTAVDYPNLPYTLAIFAETLRLYPPFINIPRTLIEPDVLGGYTFPAGTNVAMNLYAIHRHPEFWPNPEGFDPTRFLPKNSQGRHRFAYLPFSGGPRYCIGDAFAKMEAVFILAMVTQQFEVDIMAGQHIQMNSLGALRPLPDIQVKLRPRKR